MGQEFVDDRGLGLGDFVADADRLVEAFEALGERRVVGKDQFGVDDLNVTDGVDGATDVMDVVVLETADDLHNGVDFADVAEELVAEAFTGAGALDEAGDVHEFDGGWDELFGAGDFRERLESGIRHGDNADIGVDRAKGIVGRLGLAGACDRIEQGGFANIRKTDDTCGEHD